MTEPTTLTHTTIEQGLKRRAEDLLRQRAEGEDRAGITRTGLTQGEILTLLGEPKTRAPELSSALTKSRSEGKLTFETGQSSSTRGRRFVKRFRWKLKTAATAPAPTPAVVDMELRRALAGGT
jgi:hypothetical protein